MGFETIMFDGNGNIDLGQVFVHSWFFGYIDFGFIFILFATVLLLARFGLNFGQIATITLLMALVFATITMSALMWGIVIIIVVISGLRLLQNMLIRV